ncbi:MAG: M15 family peptidase [Bacteroidia bacterium]|nr:M15 family peptidase [Bacteroidia bacterium]
MSITRDVVRYGQRALQYPEFAQNGIIDQRMQYRLDQILQGRKAELSPNHCDAILSGGRERKLVAFIQLLAKDQKIETGAIDGLWGPMTDFAYGSLVYLEEHGKLPDPWRDIPPNPANPNGWPVEKEADLVKFYGEVGTHLTSVDVPYTLKINWDVGQKVNRFTCHEKVASSVVRVLTKVKNHYGVERIAQLHLDLWGGCYNKRKKRGGTQWSTHAWGIAIDFDTERNKLEWGRDQAAFARPEYDRWWEFWEEEGWVSLGRVANYDWMHVQAARR